MKNWSGSPKATASSNAKGGKPSKRSTVNSAGSGKSGRKVTPEYDKAAMTRGGQKGARTR